MSDDEQLQGANNGSWKGKEAPRSLACDTVVMRRVPKPRVSATGASWTDEDAADMDALKDQAQEDAMEVIRA